MTQNPCNTDSLRERYNRYLTEYCQSQNESCIYEASLLGKEVLNSNLGLLELTDMHNQCLNNLMESPLKSTQDKLALANIFFLEALTPCEMSLGYKSLNEKLLHANQALEQQADELQKTNEELEQFNFLASHDLQEPIRTLSLFCELLPKHIEGELNEKAAQDLLFITKSVHRIRSLIKDLLTYARVQGNVDFATLEMDACLQVALESLSGKIAEKKAVITQAPLGRVLGNESLLTHLFINLISNALKYNEQKTPTIRVGSYVKNGETIYYVEDNGIGIQPEYFDQIFDSFKRLHGKEQYSGTGIGLSICKKIIRKHSGKIWVESNGEQGTRFLFTIVNHNTGATTKE